MARKGTAGSSFESSEVMAGSMMGEGRDTLDNTGRLDIGMK